MADDKPVLPFPIPDIKFNLDAQDQFINDHGIVVEHWKAMPSTYGKKDRGDYRRPDGVDTISDNGYIYKKVGTFVGIILGNSRSNTYGPAEGGIYDDSTSRMTMPRFYKQHCNGKNDEEIALLPGDRLYAPQLATKIDNFQEAQYNPVGEDYLQFPVECVEFLQDSRGIEYQQGKHFDVTKSGNIKWKNGQDNPGVDPETGKGRLYSVRYKYLAFWYVQRVLNEIRATNKTDSSTPQRMPYHVMIQREYVYHQKNRNKAQAIDNTKEEPRTNPEPTEHVVKKPGRIKVDVKDFE